MTRTQCWSILFFLALTQPAFGQFGVQIDFLDETFEYDEENPIDGRWYGQFNYHGQLVFAELLIVVNSKMKNSAHLSIPSLGLYNENSFLFKKNGHAIELGFHKHWEERIEMDNIVSLSAIVSDDGQWLEGDAKINPGFTEDEALAVKMRMQRVPLIESLDMLKSYSGVLQAYDNNMPLVLTIGRTPKGNWLGIMEIQNEEIKVRMPILNLKRTDNSVTAQLAIGTTPLVLHAEIIEDEQRMLGTVRKGSFTAEIDLSLNEDYLAKMLRDLAGKNDSDENETSRQQDDSDEPDNQPNPAL